MSKLLLYKHVLLQSYTNLLCFLQHPPRMKFSGNFNDLSDLLLKPLLILFCALFPLLLCFFKYYNKQPLFRDRIEETPFSSLSFKFPTYEDFLRTTTQNVEPPAYATSNENDFDDSSSSTSDTDLDLCPREDPEIFLPNGLRCSNDIRIQDDNEFDDPVEAISGSFDQDFIEELKNEIMKAKAKAKSESGLPSIPEESEYPIAMEEDSKGRKKEEERLNRKGIRKELHEFHKQYTEKMRKYDTLNHQIAKEWKMKQSKGLVESVSSKGLCGCRPDKKGEAKTWENRGIEGELEVVYVVQMWVSWEFIVWQYKKALEISSREGYGSYRFNEVAEKFEHFKVSIQRFMETEWLEEGSRVEYYARSRVGRRKLLQVPLLQEDEAKDKKKTGRIEEEDGVKMDRVIEILQECIRVFWQFIRADKLAHISSTSKSHIIEQQQERTSPAYSNILNQILLDLQKKDRKLKKMIQRKTWRLKNCKDASDEDDPDDEAYFLAMVDLTLVGRVLNMQTISIDQLKWCRHKLTCISFQIGKIRIQPSSFFSTYS